MNGHETLMNKVFHNEAKRSHSYSRAEGRETK